MAARQSDVVIIGGGPGGYVAAIRLAQLGKKVTVVERERVGGVCLNWGCIPAKSLLHAASIVRGAAEARRMGISFESPAVDLQALMSWKNRIVDRLVRGIEFLFRTNGVELIRGSGHLVDDGSVRVALADGTQEQFVARHVVIATGSKPVVLPGMEPDGQAVVDSNGMFRLTAVPNRLVVIGAGVVGVEFATAFSRLGAKVTVLEVASQILPGMDVDIAGGVERAMKSEGVEFVLAARVLAVDRSDGLTVRYTDSGGEHLLSSDLVLVAVGRQPLTDGLGLERVGIELDERGAIRVDSRFRTSVRNIYAIGDVKAGPQFAHRAMAEGLALAELLAGGRPAKFTAVPVCIYSDPEAAAVGLSEAEAQAAGREVRVSRVPLSAVGRSLTLGRSDGLCKMVVDAATDRILGVSLLAPQADVLIAEATLAVELGLTARQLGRVVHAHPTMSELLFEAAEAIHGRAVHIVNR